MKYQYYPGCSLEGPALEYNLATRAVMASLGAQLLEIQDWTCCGAGASDSISYLLSAATPARNLAIAEKTADVRDILVPCSVCYLNLKKVEENTKSNPEILEKLNAILAEDHLQISGRIHVRHLLDVMAADLGAEAIRYKLRRSFAGFRIAPYYGCRCLRPYAVFDDPEAPLSMDPLIEATGATVYPWNMGATCCGALHTKTKMKAALEPAAAVLQSAEGADAIVTVCPMCQMKLEAHQQEISMCREKNLHITILYLPQFIGLALGLSAQELRIDMNLSLSDGFRRKLENA